MRPMKANPHTLFTRFQTPDPQIAPREQAPMLAQELAWAQLHAAMHRFSWVIVLVPPLVFGSVLPGLAFLVGLLVYRALVDSRVDLDHIVGNAFTGVALATVLFMVAWALHNYLRDKRDPTKRYWHTMPSRGLVELERHTLLSATCLWSNDYDPDCNTVMQWRDGELQSRQDSGVTQWLLATTATGHWLVLKKEFPGDFFSYAREGDVPAEDQHLQPLQELAIAFAPGTHMSLGLRFSGAPLPVVNTPYWLDNHELKKLIEVAHHWVFAPPARYAVVDEHDVGWLKQLLAKAQTSVGPQSALSIKTPLNRQT